MCVALPLTGEWKRRNNEEHRIESLGNLSPLIPYVELV